jgi:hypothetical protein
MPSIEVAVRILDLPTTLALVDALMNDDLTDAQRVSRALDILAAVQPHAVEGELPDDPKAFRCAVDAIKRAGS